MEEHNLQSIIEAIWPKLKKKHLYPEIPIPKVREASKQEKGESEKDEDVGLEWCVLMIVGIIYVGR